MPDSTGDAVLVMSDLSIDVAYHQGYRAFLDGKYIFDNPYPFPYSEYWEDGWEDAAEDHE